MTLSLIYPHQLFQNHPAIQAGRSGKRAEVFAHCSEEMANECAVLGEATCSSDE